jgi:RNA polymerase sigma-70 factor (ECF subfamily)
LIPFIRRQLVGGEIQAPPAELKQRLRSTGLVPSGYSHLTRSNSGQTGREAREVGVRAPRQAELQELSDADAVRLAQQGDAVAFERIYRLHSRMVYSLCLRMVGDPTQAEDLTQDVFMHLFRKIATFRGESAFSTWLHRMSVNIVLMRFRKKTVAETSFDTITNPEEEPSAPRMEFGGPDLRLNGVIDGIILQAAINELAPGYRAIFILHDVQGFKHSEIAEIFGCSMGNSKSQLHKARTLLRQLLQKEPGNGTHGSRKSAPISLATDRLKHVFDYANA